MEFYDTGVMVFRVSKGLARAWQGLGEAPLNPTLKGGLKG